VGVGVPLHVVHPISFDMSEKQVRRAGLDYWKHVQLIEHEDEEAFWRWASGRTVHLLSKFGKRSYTQCPYAAGDVLLFGCETKGLPKDLFEQYAAWQIPMSGPTRSLNLSNATAVVVYEALQTIRPTLFKD